MSKTNILVVGGAGFIGSHLVDQLLANGCNQVIVMDNMFLGTEDNLQQALKNGALLYKEDAEDRDQLQQIITTHKIEVVFNLATKALNYSFTNPHDAFMTNVKVIGNLLELQREGCFSTLCHFSSSEVYGTAEYEPMDEAHPHRPTTTYAGGKAAADLMLHTYVTMFDLDAFIVRPFNNYGPRQNHTPPLAGIIPLTIRRILAGEPPFIQGTGEQSRDFIYVRDTLDSVLKLFPLVPKGQEVNISAENNVTVLEVITTLCEQMGYLGDIEYRLRRGADVDCHNATNKLLVSLVGPVEFTPFSEGLRETVTYYRELFS